ncbi:MAG TPA: aminotransferase class I/II-fold pyridoxal phosphate-dependent enzyme, partial [Thermomicrobiales bacterium]
AERYTALWDRPVTPAQVLVTAGGINALAATALALIEAGDEVLLPDPGWPNYMSVVALAHGRAIPYPLRPERGYLPDPAEVAALITPRTKLLLLNTPSNPTGAVFPAATVAELVHLATVHDLWVLSDEIYEALVFDGTHIPAARYDDDGRVITVSGCSKTYAMTGWRLGYAIAPPDLIGALAAVQEALVSCAAAPSQRAAEAALRGPQGCVTEMRAAYARRRDLVRAVLGPAGLLPTVPQGAFYALVDLRGLGLTGDALARALLDEELVAVAPGETFGAGAAGMVRISLAAADDELAEGCRRLLAFAARHGGAPRAGSVAGGR